MGNCESVQEVAFNEEMGDVSALEKQLNVKTKQIAELQATLDEKSRKLFDYSDTLENKDRGIYYLERSIEARNRDLAELRKQATELEAKSSPDFSAKIDEAEEAIKKQTEENDALQEQVTKTDVNVKHAQYLAKKYKAILDKVHGGMPEENIVEEMQTAISELEEANKEDKTMLADLKSAVQEVEHGLDTLRGQAKFLEQFRVDAIFRVFTLKGKIKCLKNRLAKIQG